MNINFHILDGFKIGGIENLALTLSSEKISMEKNYLINLNKNIDNYSNHFSKNNEYKDLEIISCERKKSIFLIPALIKLFSKNKPHKVIIYFNNITSLWVVIPASILFNDISRDSFAESSCLYASIIFFLIISY